MSDCLYERALLSNSVVDSTTAWITRAFVRLLRVDLHSHLRTFAQVAFLLFVLALQSSFRPRRVPNILVDWAPSVPKAMDSSLPSLHFSSNSSMDSLTTSFPVFSSSVHPTNVESSANSVSVIFMVSLSLLYRIFDGSAAGKQLPGVHVQVSPHSCCCSFAFSFLLDCAILIDSAWYILNRVGEVAHPSLMPLAGIHSLLRPSFPLIL